MAAQPEQGNFFVQSSNCDSAVFHQGELRARPMEAPTHNAACMQQHSAHSCDNGLDGSAEHHGWMLPVDYHRSSSRCSSPTPFDDCVMGASTDPELSQDFLHAPGMNWDYSLDMYPPQAISASCKSCSMVPEQSRQLHPLACNRPTSCNVSLSRLHCARPLADLKRHRWRCNTKCMLLCRLTAEVPKHSHPISLRCESIACMVHARACI
jgi:hypothetical protein